MFKVYTGDIKAHVSLGPAGKIKMQSKEQQQVLLCVLEPIFLTPATLRLVFCAFCCISLCYATWEGGVGTDPDMSFLAIVLIGFCRRKYSEVVRRIF